MRLGLVYHQFVQRGGLEKYLVSFSETLHRRGHDVEVVTAKTDPVTDALPLRVHRLRRPMFSSMWRLWDFANRSEALCGSQLDVDLVLGFGRTVAQDVHRAGGGCHAIYSKLLPNVKRLGLKNRLELALERQLYTSGKTRHFVTNATKVRDELQREYGVDSSQFTVIHTAVDCDRFRPAESEEELQALRESLGMRSGRQIALFVSSSHRRKGLDTLIEAMAGSRELDNVDLWVAGAPVSQVHPLGQRVRSLGALDDMAPLYRAADFFVHPTLYDACANTVLQSMATGLPGIISSADGGAEFIDHDVNGMIYRKPTDAEELRSLLESMAALEPDAKSRMSEAARARVSSLTWDAHVDGWESLLTKLQGSGLSRPQN